MDTRVIEEFDQQTPVANYKICYLVSQSTSRRYNEDSVINFYYELNIANKINHGDRIPTFIPRVINHLTIYLLVWWCSPLIGSSPRAAAGARTD